MSKQEIDRNLFWIKANGKVRQSGKPKATGCKIKVNFNLDSEKMEEWLEQYEDKEVIQYLKYGWPVNNKGTKILEDIPKNQKEAIINEEKITEYIKKERQYWSIIVPFLTNPFGKEA